MPKLAIYVPKPQMRELEKWRKKINFSQVFTRAVMQEIRDRTRLTEESADDVANAARHYKRLLSSSAGSEEVVAAGHRLGTRHVLDCHLSPEVLRRLMDCNEHLSDDDVEAIEKAIGDDKKSLTDVLQDEGHNDDSYPTWRFDAYRGYLKGVADAWQRVREQMKAL